MRLTEIFNDDDNRDMALEILDFLLSVLISYGLSKQEIMHFVDNALNDKGN